MWTCISLFWCSLLSMKNQPKQSKVFDRKSKRWETNKKRMGRVREREILHQRTIFTVVVVTLELDLNKISWLNKPMVYSPFFLILSSPRFYEWMSQESRCVKIKWNREGGMDKLKEGSFIWREFKASETEKKVVVWKKSGKRRRI